MNAALHMTVTGAICLSSATAALAQSNGRAIACATTNVQSEKAICAWEDYRDQAVQVIRRINRALVAVDAYQSSMQPDAPDAARDMLIAAQDAWEVYREQTCALETHLYFGGSGASLAYSACLKRVTEHRNQDLRILLEED